MILQNAIKATSKYKGKSKFQFFQDIQIGDVIIISMKMDQSVGQHSHGRYATTVNLFNKRNGLKFSVSISEFQQYISRIDNESANEFYTREQVINMLEDVCAETAGNHNDYGKDKYDYLDDAKNEIAAYMKDK
jgi:hypothetical protein